MGGGIWALVLWKNPPLLVEKNGGKKEILGGFCPKGGCLWPKKNVVGKIVGPLVKKEKFGVWEIKIAFACKEIVGKKVC